MIAYCIYKSFKRWQNGEPIFQDDVECKEENLNEFSIDYEIFDTNQKKTVWEFHSQIHPETHVNHKANEFTKPTSTPFKEKISHPYEILDEKTMKIQKFVHYNIGGLMTSPVFLTINPKLMP